MTTLRIDPAVNPTKGPDIVIADDKANLIDGKEGNDQIYGLGGNDTLKGGQGSDTLHGGADNDVGHGGDGGDRLWGGDGVDTLYGEGGSDFAEGGNGGDRIEGGAGDDTLDGGNGNDTVLGGDAVDLLIGGLGGDRLQGDDMGDWIVLDLDGVADGARDTVVGTVAHLSGDTIRGFVTGKSSTADVIAITGLASNKGKLLDSIVLVDNVLSLSKVGGGTITFENLEPGMHYTDTILGSAGEILVYVI